MPGEPLRFDDVTVQAVQLAKVDAEPAWLSSAESLRASRFSSQELHDRFVARRLAIRIFAAELLGVSPERLESHYSCPDHGAGTHLDHGRPGFALAGEVMPIALSSSSSADWTLLAGIASSTPKIGIDLEQITRVGFEGFDDAVLTAQEKSRCLSLPAVDRPSFRANCWSAKEALLKADGSGLRIDPSTIESDSPQVRLLDSESLGMPAGFSAALAVQEI